MHAAIQLLPAQLAFGKTSAVGIAPKKAITPDGVVPVLQMPEEALVDSFIKQEKVPPENVSPVKQVIEQYNKIVTTVFPLLKMQMGAAWVNEAHNIADEFSHIGDDLEKVKGASKPELVKAAANATLTKNGKILTQHELEQMPETHLREAVNQVLQQSQAIFALVPKWAKHWLGNRTTEITPTTANLKEVAA